MTQTLFTKVDTECLINWAVVALGRSEFKVSVVYRVLGGQRNPVFKSQNKTNWGV